MYNPASLNPLIDAARHNGDKEILANLLRAFEEMHLKNYIANSPNFVKLGWRGKSNVLTADDMEELV